jgi:hypothetical protein
MKNRIIALVLGMILLLSSFLYAQAPDTLWTKIFGGSYSDCGYSVQESTDGGYIIAGHITSSYGAYYVWLIKTDGLGNKLLAKTFGGSGNDVGYSVQETDDDAYLITGYTSSYGAGAWDVWLIKADSLGNKLWDKTFGGTDYDCSYCVQETGDGGYIITGYTGSYGAGAWDVWLIKTDSSGDTLWTKTFGGTDYDVGRSIQETSDGGYIITGYTSSYGAGAWDVWLIRTDSLGNKLWDKTFGGTDYDCSYCVQETGDGGYIITGYTGSYGAGAWDVWLIRTDSLGNKLWDKTFGGTDYDCGHSVQETRDGSYIITGVTGSYGSGASDVWLIKANGSGDTLWTKIFGGSYSDCGYSVQESSDGGYIITGYTSSYGVGAWDVWLIKTEPDVGIEENPVTCPKEGIIAATVFSGPLLLPKGKDCAVYSIIGRRVNPTEIKPGVYFIKTYGNTIQKIVMVK